MKRSNMKKIIDTSKTKRKIDSKVVEEAFVAQQIKNIIVIKPTINKVINKVQL